MKTERLFVYGTLAPGQVNHHYLESIPGDWQTATLPGWSLNQEWALETGYPGIAPSRGDTEVKGHLLSSNSLSKYWVTLDHFEGSEYVRQVVAVNLNNGESTYAYVYAIRHLTE